MWKKWIFFQRPLAANYTKHELTRLTSWVFLLFGSAFFVQPFRSYALKTGFFQKHACFFSGKNTIFSQIHLATNFTKQKWSILTSWTFLYLESTFFVQSFRSYGQKYGFLQKDACFFLEVKIQFFPRAIWQPTLLNIKDPN